MAVVYILIFILVLGLVVCVHELGHYFFAKKAGILVNEFAFGMGPKIYSKKKGETYWSLRAFPIGGFCAMAGEEATSPILKEGDSCKLEFDKDGKVRKIILSKDDPRFSSIEETIVLKADLVGKNMSSLYINDFEVSRDATLVILKKEEMQLAPEERNFYSKKVWQKFMVCFGGPMNNFILAIVVFLLMSFIMGVTNKNTSILGSVSGPAYAAGLRKGDKITKIGDFIIDEEKGFLSSNEEKTIGYAIYNTEGRKLQVEFIRENENKIVTVYANYSFNSLGFSSYELKEGEEDTVKVICESKAALAGTNKTKAYQAGLRNGDIITDIIYYGDKVLEPIKTYHIDNWEDMYKFAVSPEGKSGGSVTYKYLRDGVSKETDKVSMYSETILSSQGYEVAYKQIGIGAPTKFSFFGSIWNGIKIFAKSAVVIFSTLWLLITSKQVGINDMGGFITILNQTANFASGGFTSLLYFIGLLSVNLGIINLLPIPALDGGRILFLGIEGIFKKKVNPRVQTIIETIVFWLLMALIVYVLFQDVLRLILQLK